MSRDLSRIILEKSIELFRKKGYNSVTVNELSAACGITKATFYHYYSSKDALLHEFFSIFSNESWIAAQPEIARERTPLLKLWKSFEVGIDETLSMGCDFMKAIFIGDFNNHNNSSIYVVDHDSSSAKTRMEYIRQCQEDGSILNASNPQLLIDTYVDIIWGEALRWCMLDGNYDQKATLRQLFKVVFCVNDPHF